ncbi:putative short-chain dehydrogenase/reductase family protein [Talaromyces proteolyticus]|uniref:Short-chain dehydrogenase/reductase family protein n=1 Tax=Talaromyces proteolyticus TaxID=1131652 RepID=A0AAD4Q6D3_9EURO|nr:putative short-chain dehydrogenase/reductase family protein [Talaromyces proteolyticus]KAH8705581.1 putative short-chain dehydrogenase/reductase family protein [Talaromyces proteolyticus]
MTTSKNKKPTDGDKKDFRSTLGQDIRAVFSVPVNGARDPCELWTAVAPTLGELTGGLVGRSFKPQRDIGDLSGKVILITGGNTGLGKETILELARHNPSRIYLAARTESKARDAIKSIHDELSKSSSSQPVDIQYIQLDLASFPSIKAAAAQFTLENTRLDRLVLNAGIMGEAAVTTPQGHEIQFGTNHVGHFLLTKLLLPTLLKTATADGGSADVRVVSVSSVGNNLAPAGNGLFETMTSTEKLLGLSTWQRYGVSKAANILFAMELARRHPEIKAVAVHPGVVSTALYDGTRQSNLTARYFLAPTMKLAFRSPQSGALSQLWAVAGARQEELVNGGYYTPVGYQITRNRFLKERDLAQKLWDWTDKEVERV